MNPIIRFLVLLKKAFAQSSKNLAVSKCLADSISKQMSVEVGILPNMIHDDFLESSLTVDKEKAIITVCGLSKYKNVESLIFAFKEYLTGSGYQLKIGGDGEERKSLENLVDRLDLREHVVFLGALSREQVVSEISTCSAFVLPSLFETFGIVLIESLALGVPVIAPKCGGPEDIIDDSNGFLVEVDDVDSLGQALLKIIERKYCSETLRENCRKKYSSKTVIGQLSKILKECV